MKTIRTVILALMLAGYGQAWSGFDEGLAAAKAGDYATALQEWRPLAEQGYAHAQYNLGIMYQNGWGAVQDSKEAVKWYHKAAEQGHADAQSNLGLMYGNGQGVPQDYVQAYKWFNIAGVYGNEHGIKNRDIAAEMMTSAQIAEAQKLAKEWMEKHP
jgi:TPR repeat protein